VAHLLTAAVANFVRDGMADTTSGPRTGSSNSLVGDLGTMMNWGTNADKKNFHFFVIFYEIAESVPKIIKK